MPSLAAPPQSDISQITRSLGEGPLASWLERWCGLAAVGGGALWLASWLLSDRAYQDGGLFAGWNEGQYRTLLNPALLLFLFALGGIYRRGRGHHTRLGRLGFWLVAASLLGFLVGNLLEYGLSGATFLAEIGWPLILLSLPLLGVGLIVIGAAPALGAATPASLSFWIARLPVLMGVSALLAMLLSQLYLFSFAIGLGCLALGLALQFSKRP